MPDWTWLLLVYSAGSLVTGIMVWRSTLQSSIAFTLDNLIKQGFVRSRKDKNGEIEILKYDHTD